MFRGLWLNRLPILCSFHFVSVAVAATGARASAGAGMQCNCWNSCGMRNTYGFEWKYYYYNFIYLCLSWKQKQRDSENRKPTDTYGNAAQNYHAKLILDACRWHFWYKDNFNWIFFSTDLWSRIPTLKSKTGMGKKRTETLHDVPLKNRGNCEKARTANIWIRRRKWKILLRLTCGHFGVQNGKIDFSVFFSFLRNECAHFPWLWWKKKERKYKGRNRISVFIPLLELWCSFNRKRRNLMRKWWSNKGRMSPIIRVVQCEA